jgi:hypothetical protein
MKTAEHLIGRGGLLTAMVLLILLSFSTSPVTAQPVRCSIETDKEHYIHDEPALVLLRMENLSGEKLRVRFAPFNGRNRFLTVVRDGSEEIFTLLASGDTSMEIDSASVTYFSRTIDLLLFDPKDGSNGYLPSGDWHLRFDLIVTTEAGAEYELPLRALIHVQAREEADTMVHMLRAAIDLVRERTIARSEEYELPKEFQDLMNSPNDTPYRNGVIGYYYSYILSSVGREIARKQGRLYENRVEYVERLLRHFAAWPDEVQAVYVWDMTIGLMVKSPPDICERALAIPGIENTRLGRYLREYACRESAAEKGGK